MVNIIQGNVRKKILLLLFLLGALPSNLFCSLNDLSAGARYAAGVASIAFDKVYDCGAYLCSNNIRESVSIGIEAPSAPGRHQDLCVKVDASAFTFGSAAGILARVLNSSRAARIKNKWGKRVPVAPTKDGLMTPEQQKEHLKQMERYNARMNRQLWRSTPFGRRMVFMVPFFTVYSLVASQRNSELEKK